MKQGIELIVKKDVEELTFGKKFVHWASSYGRIIVFSTQAIVMIAFGIRFFLDRQLNDLYSKVNEKLIVVSASETFEDSFKEAQEKLKALQDIKKETETPATLLTKIFNATPPNLFVQDLYYQKETVKISGQTNLPLEIATFANELKKEEYYKEITLTANSYSKKDSIYRFSLLIIL